MAFRLYIVPQIGGTGPDDPRSPKYFYGFFSYAAMDYGFQPIFLVAANLTAPQDAAVVANADVNALPFDLSTTVGGGNVQAAKDILEAALIPAQWVTGADTWLFVARTVAGMFAFMQRLNGIMGNTVLINDATKLNVQWSTVPVESQNQVLQAAQSLGYSTAFIQPNTQLRTILKTFADAWGSQPFQLGAFTF